MAASQPTSGTVRSHSFSRHLLLSANRDAIETGRSLISWWHDRRAEILSRTFPLTRPKGSLVAMDCFYDRLGADCASVMGCLQSARFTIELNQKAGARFVVDLPRILAQHCSWTRTDGDRGGFDYTPIFRQREGGENPEPPSTEAVDFRLEGLEWQILRVDIRDFVRAIPMMRPVSRLMSRRIREAALISVIPELCDPLIPAASEKVAETAFGYAFLPLAPEPNIFGFGPGHFRSAVKQFHFVLRPDRSLEIRLAFIVSPRSEKIISIRGFDPVYSIVDVIDRIAFRGFGLSSRFHDRMDAVMLGLHGQVHQNLLADLEPFWTKGVPVPGP